MYIYAVTAVMLFGFSQLLAQPNGFKLIQGNAYPLPPPHLENCGQVISSGNAIIEWDDFSIGEQERFEFNQGSVADTVLNRVTGSLRSEILGELHSNGKVILVNPQGVFIGPNGRVDTAGLIASSLDLSDEYFMSQNEFLFDGESMGEVVNLGIIEVGGEVFLLGPNVRNDGVIRGENVGLGVGRSILVRPEGSQRILIQIPIDTGELSHSGLIEGLKVELKSGAFTKAIQCSGVIDANRLEEHGGEIYLVADPGICEVSGSLEARRGTIHVLGDTVHLLNGTEIDVSGVEGGGEVLIGGDYQGKNQDVKNAKYVWAGNETVVKADAIEKGNGGRVIFWADEVMSHFGKISIRGGERGGDGGLAEVSGKSLDYRGFTDGGAPLGRSGTLLLDPNDIVIGASATTGSFSACVPPVSYTITSGTATNQILNTDLQTQLASCSVTISTVGSGGSGPNSGSITVSSALTWSAATTLSLTANSFISISAGISNSSSSTGFTAMNFVANPSGTTAGSFIGINVSPGSPITITSAFGHISFTGTGGTTGANTRGVFLSSNVTLTSTGSGANGASITLNGTGGSSSAADGAFCQATALSTQGGDVTIVGNAGAGGGVGLYVTSGVSTGGTGNFTLSGSAGNGGASAVAVDIEGSAVNIGGTLSIPNAIVNVGGVIRKPAVYINAPITAGSISIGSAPGGVFTVVGASGSTSQDAGVELDTSGSLTTTSGNLSIIAQARSSGSSSYGILIGANLTAASGGTITLYGDATGSGNNGIRVNTGKTIQSTAGSVSLRGTSQTGANGIQLVSTSVVKDNTSGSVSFNTASTSAIVGLSGATITSGTGNITFGGPVSLGATQSITTASPGTITFQSTATIDGAQALTLTATSSTIALSGAIGSSTRLSSLSMTASTINLGANISLNNSSLTFPVTVLTGNSTLNTGTTGAAITFNSTVNDNGSGPYALTLQGGTGAITLSGIIGGTTPIGALSIATGASLALAENISAASVSVASGINTTLSKSGTTAITTTGASGISFAGTITGTVVGAQALTLAGGTGPITLSGAVGGTRLGSMTVSTTNNTADQGLRFDANITANSFDASAVTRTTVGANATVNTSANNGTIEFGGIDSISSFNRTLTLNSGSGKIWIHGAVGANQKLGTLTITSSNTTVGQGFGIGGVINLTNFSDLSLTNLTPNPITVLASLGTAGITTTNSPISFTQTIDAQTSGSGSFTLNAGTSTISLSGAIGGTTPLGAFTCTAGTSITLPTSTKTAGGAIAINGPLPMSGAVALDSTNGGLTAAGANISITGAVTGAQALTLRAGSAGGITFGSTVGTSLTRVTTLTLTSGASLSLGGSLFLTNSVAIPMATTLTGNAEINTGP